MLDMLVKDQVRCDRLLATLGHGVQYSPWPGTDLSQSPSEYGNA
jgi:hypothetical protein